jgi:tetratricopeptide (TPR) repeat protein
MREVKGLAQRQRDWRNAKSRALAVVFTLGCLSGLSAQAQMTSNYDSLIHEGNSQLKAGSADVALTTGQSAVTADANRWEGYTLEGGALMSLNRYEEAADALSKAIERAPVSKQGALESLRTESVRLASAPRSNQVSQSEIVLWKSIESSSNPQDYQSYLDQYSHGAFASLAERRLERLSADREVAAASARRRDSEFVWMDQSTGLTWTKHDNGIDTETFRDASHYCSSLKLSEPSAWRLPSYSEVAAVSSARLGVVRKMDEHFQLTSSTTYVWTSTPQNGFLAGVQHDTTDGYIVVTTKRFGFGDPHVVCVRKTN